MLNFTEIELFDGVYVCAEKNRVVSKIDRDVYPDKFGAKQRYMKCGIEYITDMLEAVIHEVWPGLEPKEATGLGSDCTEYYDKELDNNGYLTLNSRTFGVEGPSKESERAFVLNKRKAQDLLDTIKRLREQNFE